MEEDLLVVLQEDREALVVPQWQAEFPAELPPVERQRRLMLGLAVGHQQARACQEGELQLGAERLWTNPAAIGDGLMTGDVLATATMAAGPAMVVGMTAAEPATAATDRRLHTAEA